MLLADPLPVITNISSSIVIDSSYAAPRTGSYTPDEEMSLARCWVGLSSETDGKRMVCSG